MHYTRRTIAVGLLALGLAGLPAWAQKQYDPGASDTEIRLGNLVPYSGPASAYGAAGKAMQAYFERVNEKGGINGRKIVFITLDDAYNPAKSVEQTRKLVEQDGVLAMVGSLGSAQNLAVQKYLNARKVPQLFVNAGTTRWGDPKNFHWTMGWQPSYQSEARAYAKHLLSTKPDAKIAILQQNDEFGRDYLRGFQEAMGDQFKKQVVSHLTYEISDPTIDSQMVSFKSSGADVFVNITTPKFAAQAIRKAKEMDWQPQQYLVAVSQSKEAVLRAAGFDNAKGLISSTYVMIPGDAQAQGDPDVAEYIETLAKYAPGADPNDSLNAIGYATAATMAKVLEQAGDELTRENIMKQAANLDFVAPMLYPGVDVKTSADDYFPIQKKTLIQFDGENYIALGDLYD